jgi:hypothetical protein
MKSPSTVYVEGLFLLSGFEAKRAEGSPEVMGESPLGRQIKWTYNQKKVFTTEALRQRRKA